MTFDKSSTQRFGFILLPGFALMSYASAVEPLRAANLLANRRLYSWSAYSSPAGSVESSSGATVPTGPLPGDSRDIDTLFVVAGGDPSGWENPAIYAATRGLARRGVRLGGISGGPFLLAAAGLLDSYRFTIHWEHAPVLVEAFPALRPEPARFIIDRDRITCGGGIAPLDMTHALIAERMGEAFARQVSDWFLHTHVDSPSAPQRGSLVDRYRVHHPRLVAVLGLMEGNIAIPVDRRTMAVMAGISPRHLDRLFAQHLGTTFGSKYRSIRLEHARRLLLQSPLTITEVALATGFSGAAHFARAYRNEFGHTARKDRASHPTNPRPDVTEQSPL